ncbi:MAG TPA: DinB family protein [Dehalococcoidia bacterium]|nr:DinB family protein [Dehalococcoidia bacterium]
MSKLELIRRLYEYHEWADDRLLDAAARVPEQELTRDADIPFGNVRDNLLHILGSQVSWLIRWTGESPQLAKIEPGVVAAALSESFAWAHERLRSYVGALTEEQVDAPIRFTEYDGGQSHDLERPMWEMLLSVGSHGMGHRGEVAAVLTVAGASPGEIDYSEFAWRRSLC